MIAGGWWVPYASPLEGSELAGCSLILTVSYRDRPPTQALCEAIRTRRLLSLSYRGRRRLVEPYSHGQSSDGREILVAFQCSGESSSGQQAGWKAFVVADLEDIEPLDVPFLSSRDDYRPGGHSKNLATVHCCV